MGKTTGMGINLYASIKVLYLMKHVFLVLIPLILLAQGVYADELTEKFDKDYTSYEESITGRASMAIIDFDSDGKMDGVAILDVKSSRVLAISFSGPLNLLWKKSVKPGLTEGIIIAADITGDGRKNEVVVGSGKTYVFDSSGNVEWTFESGAAVYSIATADLDEDGTPNDLVIGAHGVLYVVDHNGKSLWNITGLAASVEAVTSLDLNKNGKPEGVAYATSKFLYVTDSEGKQLWTRSLPKNIFSAISLDLDGDGYSSEIVVASSNGNVTAYDSEGNYLWSYFAYTSEGRRIKLYKADLDSDGIVNNVIIQADVLHALNPDGTNKWKFNVGIDSLSSIDFNSDGSYEGLIGGTKSKIYAINPLGQQVGFYDEDSQKFKPYNKTGAEIAISAADLDGDGYLDDVIGIGKNTIFALNHISLAPAPETPPPVTEIKVDLGPDIEVTEGAVVTLTAEATPSTASGRIELYKWSVDGVDKSAGRDVKAFSITLPPGTHTIKVSVVDDRGEKAEDTVTITVKPVSTPLPQTTAPPTTTPIETTPPPTTVPPLAEEKPPIPWLYLLIGVIIGIVVVGIIALVMLRGKSGEEWE
jgi:hypothetical protein